MMDELKKIVLETANVLKMHKLKLATAESCTGGGLSYWLTSVPQSSLWFDRGYVTYSNQAKTDMLDVKENVLEHYGAVSEETALAMAEGILLHSEADLGVAITGIAGPDGGTLDKPVGTVWIGISGKNFQTFAKRHVFTGDRQAIRLASMIMSLQMLLESINGDK
jgi:nicotinamide-nucleotide amidase